MQVSQPRSDRAAGTRAPRWQPDELGFVGHAFILKVKWPVVRRRTTSIWGIRCHPPRGDLRTGTNPEGVPDSFDVTFGGTLIDPQLFRDASIRQTLTNQFRHLPLSLGQGGNGSLAKNRKAEEAADLADQ